MGTSRWWVKANALHAGWTRTFGESLHMPGVALGLAVAEHETLCGDAWPGEHNWGAIQKRTLRKDEVEALYGLAPLPQNVAQARKLLKDLKVAAGSANEALHTDSSPGKGRYWVYFHAFPTEADAAAAFIRVVAKNRPACKAVMTSATGGVLQMAQEMYRTGYYEGFHKGARPFSARKLLLTEPEAANVADYARALTRHYPKILAALQKGWRYGATEPQYEVRDPAFIRVETVEGLQQGLNYLLLRAAASSLLLEEDGRIGSKTRAAVRSFQVAQALVPDGIPGPLTRAALRAALGQI